MKNLNVIEVCAGAGGMAMGFERAGFESLALAELNNAAVKTLHKNFAGKNVIAGDITKDEVKADIIAAAYKSKVESLMAQNPDMEFGSLLETTMAEGSDVDVFCGGIPCQSYSIMGKKEHMDCDNGMLFDHYLYLADCIKPKMLLIENVAALVTAEDSDVIEYMLAEFRKIGYYAGFQENEDLYSTVKVLNAADYGVPQRRMRVFVVAIRQDVWDKAKAMGITYNFPEPTHIGKHITLREAIKDVPESKYLTYSDNVIKVLQSASPGKAANIDLFDKSLLDENGDFAISVKRFSRYRRLDFDRVCHTVAASEPNTLCHPEYDRPLNINEIKRIQSFPDDFEFCGGVAEVYKQIGNAVPVLLAQAMATSIAEFLNAVVSTDVSDVCINTKGKYMLEVNQYGNVTAYSADNEEVLPAEWVKSCLSVTQLKKLGIPTYKACIGFNESCSYGKSYYSPMLVNIIHQDFQSKEQAYLESLSEKKRIHEKKLISNLTPDKVAEALYSVNKEAKRYRDKQNEHAYNAYECYSHYLPKSTLHYLLHQSKDKKEQMYDLKNKALSKLIKETEAKPIGYHSFDKSNMDYYEIGNYSFHANECTSDNFLGTIEELIPSKRNRSMPVKDAVILLCEYIGLNSA